MNHQPPSTLVPSSLAFASPSAQVTRPAAVIAGKASRFLARNVVTKTLQTPRSRPIVSFTFDDVPVSACTAGAAIIEQHGARATYYVSGGGCGLASPCGLLASPEDLRALWQRGHEIACHSYSHPAVSSLVLRDLAADLDRNEAFLTSIHRGIKVRNFAYPYGDLSFRTKRYLQRRFDSCRSLVPGVNGRTTDLGILKAVSLENATIERAQIARLIEAAVRQRGWLIFCGHDVADDPSQFGVTPGLLAYAATTAKAAGCMLLTVAGALDAMTANMAATTAAEATP